MNELNNIRRDIKHLKHQLKGISPRLEPKIENDKLMIYFMFFLLGSVLLIAIGSAMQFILPTGLNTFIERVSSVLVPINIIASSYFFIAYARTLRLLPFAFVAIVQGAIFTDYLAYVLFNYGAGHPEVAASLFNLAATGQAWLATVVLMLDRFKSRAIGR